MNNKLLYILFLALYLSHLGCRAQSWGEGVIQYKKYVLCGMVYDNLTREKQTDVKVDLLAKDSTELFTMRTEAGVSFGEDPGGFALPIPEAGEPYAAKEYLLRFSKTGYVTKYVNYVVPKLYKNEPMLQLPKVLLVRERKVRQLNEATVTATKVKFYSKGDTLVFNADAFQLSEGSMLDALIRQLPGAELKSDGRIYVNGQYVESLLLNGEDFFKGKNQIMLENLPTYMVKNVQVYKKSGDLSQMLGTDVGDKRLVMDVRLKKQYSIGWVGNVEAAGGTEDRYLAQLFALRFTTHSRLSFYAGLNNVNESRKPGENTEWTPQQLGDGLTTTRNGGLDYLINDKDKRFRLEGSAMIRHNDDTYDSKTSSVNFLSGGDTYGASSYNNRTHDVSLSTQHNFLFNWETVKLRILPEINYNKTSQHTTRLDVVLANNFSEYSSEEILKDLFSDAPSNGLFSNTLNRHSNQILYTGNGLNTGLSSTITIKIPHTMDFFVIDASGSYTNKDYKTFSRKFYDYPKEGNKATDFRNEYETSPYRGQDYSGKVSYIHLFGKNWTMQPYYQYSYADKKSDGNIYRLESLDGWNQSTKHEIGQLPSLSDWQRNTLDTDNTQHIDRSKNAQTIGFYLHKETQWPSWWHFTINLPLNIESERYSYERPLRIDTLMRRSIVLFNPSLEFGNSWYTYEPGTRNAIRWHSVNFKLASTVAPPSLYYRITLPYGRDPLAVTIGNADLKNSWTHSLNSSWVYQNSPKVRQVGAYWNVGILQDALCQGYVYNRATGARTYRPDNVKGNWYTNGGIYFSTPIDKKRRLMLGGNSYATFNNNVDLIGIEGENGSAKNKSTVRNVYLSQGITLDYSLGKVKVGAKGNGTWTHATSERSDFTTINAGDFNYGVTLKADLPFNFSLSTDFTVFSRRGYEDHSMNTNDLIWNARISKRFLGSRLAIMVDGFDLLHQLSNTYRSVDGQGRTEITYRVIPRYAMLHVVYRFNVAPKSK